VSAPLIDELDYAKMKTTLESRQISGLSTVVREFEEKFARFVGCNFAITVSNGSAALELALRVLGLQDTDEVIIPTFAITSVLQAVIKTGAKPIFADCDPRTWNTSIEFIEPLISQRTRAIVLVHTYGLPIDLDPILIKAKDLSITVIEDAAEAHGLDYKGKRCGSFGLMSTFSFYANKHITMGEGGAILTDSLELEERLKYLRNLAMENSRRFKHNELAENFRLGGLQASLGISQLEKIELIKKLKRNICAVYNKELCEVSNLQIPVNSTNYAENNYWVYGVVPNLNEEESSKIQKKLQYYPFFWPLHLQPYFLRNNKLEYLKNSEYIAKRGFYLPTPLDLSTEEILYICDKLKELMN
jgi:perosamine synthetase